VATLPPWKNHSYWPKKSEPFSEALGRLKLGSSYG
jgi:hypothetical protein